VSRDDYASREGEIRRQLNILGLSAVHISQLSQSAPRERVSLNYPAEIKKIKHSQAIPKTGTRDKTEDIRLSLLFQGIGIIGLFLLQILGERYFKHQTTLRLVVLCLGISFAYLAANEYLFGGSLIGMKIASLFKGTSLS
jgi:hypothetical protein